MPDKRFDIAIVGGGIIGLSTAMHLLQKYPKLKVGVVEKDRELAAQQTGHNSGVIHSGIYYKPGSFKAKFCVEGRESMYRFCEENGIKVVRCGKVIVATREAELPRLASLLERGTANGVPDLRIIDPPELKEVEPHVYAIKALWAPHTGIVNFRDVAGVYASRVKKAGGEVLTESRVRGIARSNGRVVLETVLGAFEARHMINCAGLHSDHIARLTGIDPGVRIIPFRGEYYTLRKDRQYLVKGLIYPVPDPAFPFLGVHFTNNVKGYVEAGPNAVLAAAREGYRKRDLNVPDLWGTVSYTGFWKMAARDWKTGVMEINRSARKAVFVRDLRRLIPEIASADLGGGGSGVRAQAVDSTGKLLDDFHIKATENAVHVLNAPSPGATSSLVIGRYIVDMAAQTFGLN